MRGGERGSTNTQETRKKHALHRARKRHEDTHLHPRQTALEIALGCV